MSRLKAKIINDLAGEAYRQQFGEVLLTTEEAFKRINVSRSFGYKLIQEGRLKAIRLGKRRWAVPVAALEALLFQGAQDEETPRHE